MLTAEVPADVHQLDGVERGPSAPWGARRVRAFALEAVLDRDEAIARGVAPGHLHVRAHMGEKRDVDVLEDARTYVIRLGAEQFFRDPRPQLERASQVLLLHDLLHRQR